MDDFDDFDGLFSDLDREDLAVDGVDVDQGAGGLTDADWREAFAPYAEDGSITPEALDAMWAALDEWEAADAFGDFEIVADFDVDAGEGNYL